MIPLHGIASRDDLPLPLWLVLLGAAVALVVTFWVAVFAWREPRYVELRGKELPALTKVVDSPWLRWPLRLLVALFWGLALLGLLFGPDRLDNPVFGFVFVWLWVGLVPLSLLLGGFYRNYNPVRWLLHDPPRRSVDGAMFPAALALVGFGYLELVEPNAATLPVLRVAVGGWFLWLVIGRFLAKDWIARADPFEAYATLISKMSCWARSARGLVLAVNPLRQLASWKAPRGLGVLVSVLLGLTLFDALGASTWWVTWLQQLSVPSRVMNSFGLLGTIGLLAVGLLLCSAAVNSKQVWKTWDALAPGMVPLVVGYALAHYATMLYLEGQRTAIWFSDPLALGWNLFGTAEMGPNTALLGYPTLIAVTQVLLIVSGHILAALVTHDIALRSDPRPRAQLPLLAFMILITVSGLSLMFSR